MRLPTVVPKLKRSLAREQIHSQIQAWVIEGTLRPGEVIHDKQVAEAFGVSRTPVREALRTLEDQGLVDTALNQWTRVAPLRMDQVAHLHAFVPALEEVALCAAWPRLGADARAEMMSFLQSLQAATESRDAVKAAKADSDFHMTWIRRSRNPELERVLADCRTKLVRLEIAYFQEADHKRASLDEHRAIAVAVEAGDLLQTLSALTEHWALSVDRCADLATELEELS